MSNSYCNTFYDVDMKRKPLIILSISIIAVLIFWIIEVLFFVGDLSFKSSNPAVVVETKSVAFPQHSDTAFGGIFNSNQFDENLPYKVYKAKVDSAKSVEDSLSGLRWSYNGVSYSGIGLYRARDYVYGKIEGKSADRGCFIRFDNYGLDPLSKVFYNNGTCNLVFPIYGKKVEGHTKGYYSTKVLPFRYIKEKKQILFSISKNTYSILQAIFVLAGSITFVLSIFSCFLLPIILVLSISNRLYFVQKNLNILKRIAVFGFIVFGLGYICPAIVKLIIRINVPKEFFYQPSTTFDVFGFLASFFYPFIAMALYIAFKRGYKLQQEQDLTV